MRQAERVVEWAQANATLAVRRGLGAVDAAAAAGGRHRRRHPARLAAAALRPGGAPARRLRRGQRRPRTTSSAPRSTPDVRALNPGLAVGRLRVAPEGRRLRAQRDRRAPETPADLEPAAGILTAGRGQRAVARAAAGARARHSERRARPRRLSRGSCRTTASTCSSSHSPRRPGDPQGSQTTSRRGGGVYEEYTRNETRAADGSAVAAGRALHIDRAKIDLDKTCRSTWRRCAAATRAALCGPKAAYLGELKHLFPDHVARGIVVPVRRLLRPLPARHGRRARQVAPRRGIATAGRAAAGVRRAHLQDVLRRADPRRKSERELSAWIAPRLDDHPRTRSARRRCRRSCATASATSLDRVGLAAPDPTSRHRRLLRAQRHQRRGPRQLQRRRPQPHRSSTGSRSTTSTRG